MAVVISHISAKLWALYLVLLGHYGVELLLVVEHLNTLG